MGLQHAAHICWEHVPHTFWSSLSILTLLLIAALLMHRMVMPKPLSAIPYNPEALHRLFGDIPSIIAWNKRHGEQRKWFQAQAIRHNSPIVQVFTKPFWYGPQVVLTDHKEIHDIFHHRWKEFDKGYKESEAFGGIIPDELLSLKLRSPEYKFHKDLMRDLMLPQFLHTVNAPQIYDKSMLLIDLWKRKAEIAAGAPFIFRQDIHMAALDIIMAASFGLSQDESCITKQIHALPEKIPQLNGEQPSDATTIHHFEDVPMDSEAKAITDLAASVQIGFSSPIPVQHHWFLRQLPHLRGAIKIKNGLMRRKISESLKRMPRNDEEAVKSARTALDNMLYRERLLAQKAGREPNFHASYIYDEMLAYVIAGHDTTSSTLSWGLMYLADHQQPQETLRHHLSLVYSQAVAQQRQPTAHEIISSHAPYLDAVIEEILRVSVVLPMISREALVDTTILGYPIPKGTLVMCLSNGPSFFSPGISVDEHLRTKESAKVAGWDDHHMDTFKPERWLERSNNSAGGEKADSMIFNSRKGPMNSFGGGPRGCFGKRLAYMEMRILVVLLFFNFKLLPIDPELRSYRRHEQITVEPADCHIRLRVAPLWM
ncbi:cytochrome P450 [Phaeosphaeria sp. MPI-PUGE-AT-0046c]|nr:cytochrome P450 [Phaeosphaeria sp. MPI-PUGE-AT-0046c]